MATLIQQLKKRKQQPKENKQTEVIVEKDAPTRHNVSL